VVGSFDEATLRVWEGDGFKVGDEVEEVGEVVFGRGGGIVEEGVGGEIEVFDGSDGSDTRRRDDGRSVEVAKIQGLEDARSSEEVPDHVEIDGGEASIEASRPELQTKMTKVTKPTPPSPKLSSDIAAFLDSPPEDLQPSERRVHHPHHLPNRLRRHSLHLQSHQHSLRSLPESFRLWVIPLLPELQSRPDLCVVEEDRPPSKGNSRELERDVRV